MTNVTWNVERRIDGEWEVVCKAHNWLGAKHVIDWLRENWGGEFRIKYNRKKVET